MSGDYAETVKQLQAEAMAALKRDIASAERAQDPFRADKMLLGLQLAKARLRKHLTQQELAARIGTTQAVVSRLENGKGNPRVYTFLMAAKVLDAKLMLEYKND